MREPVGHPEWSFTGARFRPVERMSDSHDTVMSGPSCNHDEVDAGNGPIVSP